MRRKLWALNQHPKQNTGTPYEILAASEQVELVAEAVRHLTNSDREVLLLKYTENWSCQKIATRLGVSLSAIKSRLLRARGNLRRELLRISKTWDLKMNDVTQEELDWLAEGELDQTERQQLFARLDQARRWLEALCFGPAGTTSLANVVVGKFRFGAEHTVA